LILAGFILIFLPRGDGDVIILCLYLTMVGSAFEFTNFFWCVYFKDAFAFGTTAGGEGGWAGEGEDC